MRMPTGRRLRILKLLIENRKMTGSELVQADPSLIRGMIYTTLHRLEDDKLIRSDPPEVHPGKPGAPPRYYEITGFGRKVVALANEAEALRLRTRKTRHAFAIGSNIRLFAFALIALLTATVASRADDRKPTAIINSGDYTSFSYPVEPHSHNTGTYKDGEPKVAVRDLGKEDLGGPFTYDTLTADQHPNKSRWSVGRGITSVLGIFFAIAVFLAWREGILRAPLLVWALFIGGQRGLRQFRDMIANHKVNGGKAVDLAIDATLLTISCLGDQFSQAWKWFSGQTATG